ncbi:hypothetical protein E0632_26430, partial [Salmonella enterica subsp. enterica]|nr:hypothetical protein [Salmonella enterica subsp. enterica]
DEARPQRIAIMTNRDVETYAAIYGLIALGHSYVPLNPAWPVERLSMILDRADVDAVIYSAGPRISGLVGALQERHSLPFVKLAHEGGVFRVDCEGVRSEPRNMATDVPGLAYIMFTSGSTGVPKGVPITRANVEAYVAAIIGQYPFEAGDRVVQTVEMTFDLSVHDMMLSWVQGCCLLSVPANASQLAPRLIAQQGGTHWLTVPSAAAQAKILGLLKPGAMPSMKTLMFCGEALPQSLALACAEAAPNAKLVNIYGPTEATIAISAYDWTEARTRELDVVPLGEPIGEQQISLSAEGEIMLSGTQLSSGYLNDPEKTQDRFRIIGGRRWYLTGDLGAFDPNHGFIFRGRMDS